MSVSSGSYVFLCQLADLPEGKAKVFPIKDLPGFDSSLEHLEEFRVAVARVGTIVYAIEDRCSHDGGPLGSGPIEGKEITCTRHGARFNLESGKPTRMPAITPVMVFPVRIVNDQVEIDLSRA